MKKFTFFLSCIIFLGFMPSLKAQHQCGTIDEPIPQNEFNATERSPSGNPDCRKVIKINIHYVLKSDGTGNFTETADPNGGTNDNGFIFAQAMVDEINHEWSVNEAPWRPYDNNYPVNPINLELDLKGVYFIRNTSLYNTSWASFTPFINHQVNPNSEINIFMIKDNPSSGVAYGISPPVGRMMAKIHDTETLFDAGGHRSYGFNIMHRTLDHEIGHLLNLRHPFQNDGFADTHDPNPCWQYLSGHPTCGIWGNITNTYMNYTAYKTAKSASQINEMHSYLDGVYRNYADHIDETSAQFSLPSAASGCNNNVSYGVPFTPHTVNADQWKLEIWRTSSYCSSNNLGNNYSSGWQSSSVYSGNLSNIYSFGTNKFYKVTLTTRSACGDEETIVKCVYIYDICATGNGGYYFTVHPNPASDFININIDSEEDQEISFSILSATSRTTKEHKINDGHSFAKGKSSERFDVSDLAPGIYFLRARVGDEVKVKRFVISR